MDIKELKSKINLLEAQIKQIQESGFFNEQEIERLTAPMTTKLGQMRERYNAIIEAGDPNDFDVVAETIS